MAQLRQDYSQFLARDIEVVVVGPEDAKAFAAYFQKESLPFVGLPDPKASVLKLYGQEVNLFKLIVVSFDCIYSLFLIRF